jgi:hypothetical protein
MPIYEITAPDGKTYEIEGPPGASRQDVINAVLARNPAAGQAPAAPPAPKEGIMAALTGGAKRFGSTIETGLESVIDPNLAAQRGVARSEALGQEYAPATSLEKVKQAYAEKGLFPAAYEAISQIPGAISENLPNMGATLTGGRVGAMAGSAFGPVGALVGGGIGAATPSLLQLYGSNLERQAQEGSKNVSRTTALSAAVPGAAAEVVSTYIPLGRTFIGKLLGPEAEKALARGTSQSIETAAKESVMATLAKGTAIGAGTEIPTEVGQQMLERLQAGLPLTTPDALKEYGESAYGAALVGGPLGAGARALGRSGAREEYKALKQKEEQAAFDAERQAALDKYNAEEAEAQKQRDITRGQLGADPSQMLALPAPDKEVKPVDETRELINPVGDITRDELAPEVTKYIDTYRKDNGLPRLKTFSVEDVKDAMTQVNPKGEQAALDSILTAKTGYTGEQKYTAENVLDAAVEKNVATETKGFNDFLARVTGTSTLDTMTQPQLFAAFKALKDMKREDTTQQLVLPEGSNASRYTQRQYDQALDYVRSSFEESGNKPLSTETILTDIKDSTKLETERDAMALLDAAIKNEDLSQSREVVFRTYREGQERPVATYRDKAKAQAAAKKQGLNVKEEALVQVAPAEAKVAPETKRAPLPTGYEIKESLLDSGAAPAEFAITPEGRGKRLTAVPTEGEATAKIPKLQALRAQRAAQMDANIAKSEGQIAKGQAQLDRLEADGKGDTEQYKVLQAKQASRVKTMNSRIELFKRQKEEFLAPLQAKPAGQKTLTRQAFTVSKDGKTVGSFPSRQAAEESILTNLPDEELAKVASDTRFGGITDRAVREQERRKEGKTGIEVKGTKEGLEKAGVETVELKEKLKALEDKLVPLLSKFGLKDVALNVVKSIEKNAEGSYIDKLIKIAMDAENPIRTMRHEALHAMKELGFFTDAQWKALEKQAKDVWIDKYLGGQMAKVGDKVMTRLEAYKQMGLSEAEIIEEAIADAFGDFDTAGTAPPGMLQALFKRMQQFFSALRQALGGAGFESAEEIFGKIERGELEPKQATSEDIKKETTPSEVNAWKADDQTIKAADKYEEENGIRPYVSEGRLDLPTDGTKYSVQKYNPEKHLRYEATLGVPINKDGLITLYYHTTKDKAVKIGNKKIIPSDGRNRIYVTNESVGADVLRDRGNFDQELDGSTVLIYVHPEMLQLDAEYSNGRRDFFIPLAQGDFFSKKMKLQSIQKSRTSAITETFSYSDHEKKVASAVSKYKEATPAERRKMVSDARKLLKAEHNVSSLLSENGKLEKTRVGEYDLDWDGNSVASMGLGLASAQQISDKVSTCPRSAICEGLCLGETSGGNFMFGGAASEDVGDIQKSSFRAAARMMQYLKTEALVIHPEEFSILLQAEIDSLSKWCASETQNKRNPETKKNEKIAKEIYQPAVRLNVTSDFKPSMFRAIIENNPDTMFYDYTKLGSESIAPNHHLTYSSTGFGQIVNGEQVFFKDKSGKYDHNWATMRERLNNGQNVAMAFSSKSGIPSFLVDEETGTQYRVWNGDDYDARFLDPKQPDGKGMIIGLKNKAGNLKESTATAQTGGFFVQYDPKKDGDTVVVPKQDQFKGERRKVIDIKPAEKLSLKTFFPTAEEAEAAAYEKAPPSTAAFKRFFGASRVMEEGRAQVMYHGSPDIFESFYENKPIFVTPDPSFAEEFARDRAKDLGRDPDEAKVYPLWVRAETPFDYENPEHVQLVANKIIADQKLASPSSAVRLKKSQSTVAKFQEEMADGLWSVIEDPVVQDALKTLGFDSFNVKEGGSKNLAVFTANQVKSITGNIGDFSLETKDMRYSLKKVRYSDDRFEKLWDQSFYTQNGAENKTKGYLAFVNPMDFVLATASPETLERLRKEQEPLDFEKMKNYGQVPYLSVSEKDGNWKITGHEGRHRLLALHDAGYREVPVYIDLRTDNAESIPVKMLTAQFTESVSPFLMAVEVEPLSYANKQKAKEKFTRMESKVKYSLPSVSAGANDRVNVTTTVRENDGFVSRMLKAISPESRSYFRQQAINRYNQLSVIDKMRAEKMGGHVLLADQSAESAALLSDLGAGITASAMGFGNRMGGIPIYKNGVTTVINNGEQKGLIAALAPLAKYGDPKVYQYYQFWAAVKRGERLYAEGREQLIQPGDKAFAKELEEKFPEFVQVQKDFNAFNEGLVQYMVDTGVLSEAQGREYVKHADYVPFYRQLNEEKTIGPNIFQSISGVKQPRKLKGGEAPLADFLETVVRNTQAFIQAGIKNAAAQRAVNAAMDVGTDIGAERLSEVSSAPDTVTVLEKGKKVSYRVADRLFIEAVKSLNIPELPFMTLLSAPSNTLRNLVTKDPGFMMANLMRDSLSAWVTSGQDIKPIIGTVQNFAKALAGKSPGMEALLNAGVIGGYEFSNVVEASAEKLAKDMQRKYGSTTATDKVLRPFTWVWEALEKGTEASDAATRIAVYERVMEETGNEAEALYRALEVMNFNRKGSSAVVRILTAAVPFLNARVQGLDIFYRASFGQMATKDAKAIQKAFWVRGMTMMALSSMYFLAVSDDEEYKKQEAETKDNYWIIPGVGKFPTPFEVGVLFKTIPERILAYSFKDDTGEDFKKSMTRALVSTFAFNPIPQTVKPIVETTTNYSFFTMRPIVGQGMEKVAPEFQVGPSTSKLAEMIGSQLGLSPIKIDAIIQGYTGTIGMYGVQAIDAVLNANSDSPNASKRFEQLPIIKRFALDPEARGNITQYYELKNAVDSLAATSSLLEKSMKPDEWVEYMRENKGLFATQDYVRDLEKEMKELREMRRLVQTGSFSADSKRDYLTTIGQAENNLTKNIQTVKKLIASYQ